MLKERSKMILVSVILATAYFIYLLCYFSGIISQVDSGSGAKAVAGALATALVMPHMIAIGVGAVFAWVGFFLKANWATLVGAILYAVSAVLFLPYFMFSVPILILGFIGYSMQKKINQQI